MKKIIISTVLLVASISTHANNFNMPWGNNNGYNNGSSWNMPNMNWGNNGNNGSSWNMPTMNWGNNGNNSNGYNNGSNMNMPNMPWGNNNGYNNGSNWNMPTMNWGNNSNGNNSNGNNGFNNGTNWNMPNMNWGNGNNHPWNFGNSVGNTGNRTVPNTAMPNVQYRAPAMPVAPQFIPRLNVQKKAPAPLLQKPIIKKEIKAAAPAPAAVKVAPPAAQAQTKIPMPSEVKGTILAPENKVESVEIKK